MKDVAIVALRPVDALIFAADATFILDTMANRPGAFIERMPLDIRAALQRLTSDDALNVRIAFRKARK